MVWSGILRLNRSGAVWVPDSLCLAHRYQLARGCHLSTADPVCQHRIGNRRQQCTGQSGPMTVTKPVRVFFWQRHRAVGSRTSQERSSDAVRKTDHLATQVTDTDQVRSSHALLSSRASHICPQVISATSSGICTGGCLVRKAQANPATPATLRSGPSHVRIIFTITTRKVGAILTSSLASKEGALPKFPPLSRKMVVLRSFINSTWVNPVDIVTG